MAAVTVKAMGVKRSERCDSTQAGSADSDLVNGARAAKSYDMRGSSPRCQALCANLPRVALFVKTPSPSVTAQHLEILVPHFTNNTAHAFPRINSIV